MNLKLTRLLPNKAKTPILVNWDAVIWMQTFINEVSVEGLAVPTIVLKHAIAAGTVLLMANGPELYVEESFGAIELQIRNGGNNE